MRSTRSIALLLALVLPAAAQLPAPTGASFAKGAKFTVAGYTNANGTARSELTGFPVLVRISEDSPSGFSYADLASSTGDDLCFIDMDGNGLPFEIDEWHSDGTSLVWVRLPKMTNEAEFVMCWGGGTSGKTVCNDNPWSDYVGVWHMWEASGTVADSTGNGFNATPSGTAAATACVAVTGPVGNGRQCSTALGADNLSYLSVSSYDSKSVGDTFAVSGWASIGSGQTGSDNDARLFSRKENYQNTHGWEVLWKTGKEIRVRGAASGDNIKVTGRDYAGKGWKHFFIVYDGRNSLFYENGVQKGSKTGGTAASENGRPLGIGGYANDNGSQLVGSVDECRLLDAVPGADWVWAEYTSMADAAFLTAGEAQSYGGTFPPAVSLSVTDRQYTNAAFTISVGSIGTGGMQADVSVAFSADDNLANPLWTTNYTVQGVDAQTVSLVGLATGTTYYMQAQIVNDQNVTNTSPVVTLATLTPGAPAGTATFDERGFSTLAATGTTTAFGTGGESAAMRLEASTDGFETVAAFSPEVVAALGESAPLTISGLSPGTAYALRLRITNNWGVAATVALPDVSTRAVPFATTGIGWTFSADGSTVDITFGVSGVYDGATGSAALYFDASSDPRTSQGAQAVSAAETLSWSGLGFSADPMHAKVILSATLDGRTYSATNAATIAAGSTAVSVSDISEHTSAETAIRVHAGDVVTLPELSGTARYIVGNKLFGSLEGNVLTALRPGILGIHCVDNDSNTNTLAVLVLPEKIGNGDIYIFKDGSVGNNWCYWNETAKWEKLGSEENDSWPHNPDDIAIIAFYKNTGVQFDSRADDIELAGLYAGGYCDKQASASLRCVTKQSNVLLTSAVRFRRSDGEPVLVQLCSNATDLGNNQFRTTFTVADSVPFLEYASDTILSGGWDGTDSRFPQGRFSIGAKTNAIPEGVTVELVEMDTQGQSMGCTLSITRLAGKGTFWNRSSATMRVYGSPLFEGLLRDSGGYKAGTDDRTGPTYVRTDSLTNVAAEVVGWVGRSGSAPESNFTKGVGALVSGWPHFFGATGPHDPWFPRKGTTMHGGLLFNRSENDSRWIATAATNFVEQSDGSIKTNVTVLSTIPDKRLTEFLDIADGFVYLRTYSDHVNYPTTWFEADDLRHGNRASLYAVDARIYGTGNATNTATILHGASAHAVGAAGDPLASNAYPIVPWIATQVGSKAAEDMGFAAFDGDGWLTGVFHEKYKALSTFGATDNAYVFDAGIALDEDLACNSLSLHNDRRDKLLGEGRTLTITSGGLILGDIDWDSTTTSAAIGAEDGGAANGALVLGDAEHPAYVWARGKVSDSTKYAPNEIWAPVTAPGGFVCAYTGDLVLGGNQTNILDEIVVNAGTLQLGTAASSCRLRKDLPIRLYANATLKLPNADSTTGKLLYFDGGAGWFGKVEIAEGVAAQVKKAFVRDYPESPEWEALPRGFYGSSESGVEALATVTHPAFVRDDLFSGTGTLKVVADDRIPPTLMILR